MYLQNNLKKKLCFVIASCSRNSMTSLGCRTNEPLSV